jgi:prevent-host-death family protein
MRTLPLSEADAGLTQIADEVHRTHERVTVTKDGHPYLVLISPEDASRRSRRPSSCSPIPRPCAASSRRVRTSTEAAARPATR